MCCVRLVGVGLVLVLFRRHVVGCANAGTSQVHRLIQHLRDPEVTQLHDSVAQEYVRGL